MIADILRAAWAESPTRTLLAVLLTPVVLYAGYVLLVVVLVAGEQA